MGSHCGRTQRKVIRRVVQEGQRGVINSGGRIGDVKAVGGGQAVGGHGNEGVEGESTGGSDVTGDASTGIHPVIVCRHIVWYTGHRRQ